MTTSTTHTLEASEQPAPASAAEARNMEKAWGSVIITAEKYALNVVD